MPSHSLEPAAPALGPPDQITVWPVEGGRYGIDATWKGASGLRRADHTVERLRNSGVRVKLVQAFGGNWSVRLGPLDALDAGRLVTQFMGLDLALNADADTR